MPAAAVGAGTASRPTRSAALRMRRGALPNRSAARSIRRGARPSCGVAVPVPRAALSNRCEALSNRGAALPKAAMLHESASPLSIGLRVGVGQSHRRLPAPLQGMTLRSGVACGDTAQVRRFPGEHLWHRSCKTRRPRSSFMTNNPRRPRAHAIVPRSLLACARIGIGVGVVPFCVSGVVGCTGSPSVGIEPTCSVVPSARTARGTTIAPPAAARTAAREIIGSASAS